MTGQNRVPACSCSYNVDGAHLHADDCRRLVGLIRKYHPKGYGVENRRIVRPPVPPPR